MAILVKERKKWMEEDIQGVMESTIIATIHCPDVGDCLFGKLLVTYIPYHVPCTFLIVIVSYWVLLSLVRLLALLAPLYSIRILYASYYVLLD